MICDVLEPTDETALEATVASATATAVNPGLEMTILSTTGNTLLLAVLAPTLNKGFVSRTGWEENRIGIITSGSIVTIFGALLHLSFLTLRLLTSSLSTVRQFALLRTLGHMTYPMPMRA